MSDSLMQYKKRLFLDMDGTIARFHDNILDENGHVQIELMYQPEFFRTLEPFQNMIDAMKMFISTHSECEVYTLSAAQLGDPPGFVRQKDAWLDEFLPEIDKDHRLYPECGVPKSGYIPGGVTRSDYLIDDFNKNLREWVRDGGKSIKCKNNINHKGLGKFGGSAGNLWAGDMVSNLDRPEDILKQLEKFIELENMEFVWLDGYPIDDNYPSVEVDISKRDLQRVLDEVFKEEAGKADDFLKEYDWDDTDLIIDFIKTHSDFLQDPCKITDFSDAKYAVTITKSDLWNLKQPYKDAEIALYPENLDVAFVKRLFEMGYEGFHALITDIRDIGCCDVYFDGVIDSRILETFTNIEKQRGSFLDARIQEATQRCDGNFSNKIKNKNCVKEI